MFFPFIETVVVAGTEETGGAIPFAFFWNARKWWVQAVDMIAAVAFVAEQNLSGIFSKETYFANLEE